jgi:hypothetical protein
MAAFRRRGSSTEEFIYDLNGVPVYRVLRRGRIVDLAGRSVAWIDERRNIYDYHGMHRGWYEDGAWVAHDGGVMGFGERVEGPCPRLPERRADAPRGGRPHPEPRRPQVYAPPPKPERRPAWARRPLGARWGGSAEH